MQIEVGAAIAAAVDALERVPRTLDPYRALGDDALLALTRTAADEVRLAQLHVSLLAGEIARRSSHELGAAGLAQRTGHRTADELVTVTTGTRRADARTAVRVGAALGEGAGVARAVLEGRVSVALADSVQVGLGAPSVGLTAEMLDAAAEQLLTRVAGLGADRALREARAMRDDLDLLGVPEREEARRQQRSLRIGRRADGMGYASWTLDPESFALVSEVYDRLTAPQRRVPSFADGDGRGLTDTSDQGESGTGGSGGTGGTGGSGGTGGTGGAGGAGGSGGTGVDGAGDPLVDTRTDAQRASDGFVELLRQGVAADPAQLLGDGPIGVRVLVAAQHLGARRGRGFLEGQHDPVSIATVERIACAAGTVALLVGAAADNAGQPLNLGRERRLFSRAQRLALAARDGGCRWPGCERPPSWCEAHHIEHWQRDGGRTDVADGVLLCRHHHLLAHNNGWEITRAGPRYLLHPPGSPPGGPPGSPPGGPVDSPPGSPARALLGAPPGSPARALLGAPPDAIEMPSRSRALSDALVVTQWTHEQSRVAV